MKRRIQLGPDKDKQTDSHFSHSILPQTTVKLTTQYAPKFISFNFQSIHHAPQSILPHTTVKQKSCKSVRTKALQYAPGRL